MKYRRKITRLLLRQKVMLKKLNRGFFCRGWYQDKCRIYLDEYEGQEKRLKIYKKNKLKNQRAISIIMGKPHMVTKPILNLIDDVAMLEIKDPYQHFINRFNKKV